MLFVNSYHKVSKLEYKKQIIFKKIRLLGKFEKSREELKFRTSQTLIPPIENEERK